jgi:hypothetical protein
VWFDGCWLTLLNTAGERWFGPVFIYLSLSSCHLRLPGSPRNELSKLRHRLPGIYTSGMHHKMLTGRIQRQQQGFAHVYTHVVMQGTNSSGSNPVPATSEASMCMSHFEILRPQPISAAERTLSFPPLGGYLQK